MQEINNLEAFIPYNEFIGDLTCLDFHLVKVIEEWKDVPGYEGLYIISTFGRIANKRNNRLLKPSYTEKGYTRIALTKDGNTKHYRIGRMVLLTFKPLVEGKNECNHIKGIKDVNWVYHLEWATHAENVKHAYDTKLALPQVGVSHGRSVLNDDQVRSIRKLLALGTSQRKIASAFNVSQKVITQINTKKSYLDIQ